MKKFFYLFFLIILSLFSFSHNSFLIIRNRSQAIDDGQITTLVQKNLHSSEKNTDRILSGEKRTFSFVADSNNLGIIAILFDNHEKVTSDNLWFRLKEIDSSDWIYEEEYSTEKISEDYYYTFGFSPISNSKGKKYLIEMESVFGELDNSVSLHEDSDFFIAKYSYSKSYLFQNKKEVIPFVKNRVIAYLRYLSLEDAGDIIFKTILDTIIILTMIFFIKTTYIHLVKKYFIIFNNRKKGMAEYFKKYFSSPNFLVELFIILTPVTLLLDTAFFSPSIQRARYSLLLLAVLIFANLIYLFVFFKISNYIYKFLSRYFFHPVMLSISLFVFLRLKFMDSFPRWDSAVYYHSLIKSIGNFDFSFNSFMAFNWYKHPSMGFGLFSAIFQFLNPGNIYMLNIENIVLGIIAIFSFYLIAIYFFTKKRNREIILLTTLFALNPLFFSVSTSFLPDFGVIVFFLAAIASFLHKKHSLLAFFFLMAIFSKETGAYTYALFSLFYLLIVMLKRLPKIKINYLFNYIALVIPGIIYFFYLLYTRGAHWTAGKPIVVSSDCFFCFSFQPTHFIQNLDVMFILNFSWILTLVILSAFIKQIVIKKIIFPIESKLKRDEFISLVFSLLGFIAFFMVFVIYIIPSYMLISIFFLILIFYYSLVTLVKNNKTRLFFLALVSFLFLIQNFMNIDFLSSKIFGSFNFGKYKMVKVGSEYLCDGLIYNTQYLYIDRLINKFHKDFRIGPDDNIVMDSSQWHSFYLGGGGYNLYIDKNSLKKTFSKSMGFRPGIYSLKAGGTIPLSAYYLAFPWIENEEKSIEIVKSLYNINKETMVEIDGYWLNVYSLTKK